MKKFLALALAAILLFAVAACGTADPAPTPAPASDAPAEPAAPADPTPAPADEPAPAPEEPAPEPEATPAEAPTDLTVYFFGATVTEDAAIMEAASKRLQDLGVNVNLHGIWGNWDPAPGQNILDTGNTDVDVVFTCSWAVNFVPNALAGNFTRLDELIAEYGQDMKAAVPSFLWDAFVVNTDEGIGLYGIPGYKDYAQSATWDINNTRLSELGYNVDDYTWNRDILFDPVFEEMLAKAKETYGADFYPLLPGVDGLARFLSYSDTDYTGLGSISFPFDPVNPALPERPEVKLLAETTEYVDIITKLHDFYNKGYINPTVGILAESSNFITGAQETANYLFCDRSYSYGYDVQASTQRGIDARFMPISAPNVSTISAQGSGFAVPVYSRNPELAVQFMNAWYTDKELADILSYGIEGDYYTRNADGTVTLDVDKRAEFAPWANGMGNIYILSPQDINGPTYFDDFKAFNEQGVATAFNGFTFNQVPVETQLAALTSVRDEYKSRLDTGVADPEVDVPAFIQKMNDNGFQAVMTELNAQLDEFFANK